MDQPTTEVTKSDQEWREQLSGERFEVLRMKGTEPAWSGEYVSEKRPGIYCCAACDGELFRSDDKFESGTGWPSFTKPSIADAVALHADRSHGMVRTEVTCRRCGSHLGHVFDDGPGPAGQRYCMNSLSLELKPNE